MQTLEGQKKGLEEFIKAGIRELQRGENEDRAHQKTMSFEGLPQLRDRDEALKNLIQATNRSLERIDGDYQHDINDIDGRISVPTLYICNSLPYLIMQSSKYRRKSKISAGMRPTRFCLIFIAELFLTFL